MIIRVFLVGWVILVVAIGLNFLAGRLGITTWYPFFDDANKMGIFKAFEKTSLLSKIFLLGIYPALLGLSSYLILKILK
jgi:hypothetical protein